MFRTRLISGIVLVIIAAVFIIAGGDLLLALVAAISLVGMYELYRIFAIEKSLPGLISYAAAIAYYANLRLGVTEDGMLLVMAYLIALMFAYVFTYPKYRAKRIMAAFFGLFYVTVMLSYVYRIRMLDKGLYLTALIFLCSWGCDTCAYCVGMLTKKLWGNHKMSPKLSPNKSIEGAVGGVLGAVLLTALYLYIFRAPMQMEMSGIWLLAGLSAIPAMISMVGDLTASAIKRNYDIKDYGNLIPGHGGILDRFDSMMITAPILYYIAVFFLA